MFYLIKPNRWSSLITGSINWLFNTFCPFSEFRLMYTSTMTSMFLLIYLFIMSHDNYINSINWYVRNLSSACSGLFGLNSRLSRDEKPYPSTICYIDGNLTLAKVLFASSLCRHRTQTHRSISWYFPVLRMHLNRIVFGHLSR